MKSIEESVVTALDGSDLELFPYLPYILQDSWELGASPEIIMELVKKHVVNPSAQRVLDLGCGKGAVSVRLAEQLHCHCLGIDAVKEFVQEAADKAVEYGVEELCTFEVGDIRINTSQLAGFDIIILGAIGPVFGSYYDTLTTLSRCLKENGLLIIDDAYIEDNSDYQHPLIEKRSDILKQIKKAGMQIIDETISDPELINESDQQILTGLIQRCKELMKKHPDKKTLLENYIKKQEEESQVLQTKVTCTTMLIQKQEGC